MEIQQERVATAIVDLARRHSVYGLAVAGLNVHMTKEISRMIVGQCAVWINPEYIDRLHDDDELQFVLAVAGDYVSDRVIEKREHRNSWRWNVAAYMMASHRVTAAGLGRAPSYAMSVERVSEDMTVERMYDSLGGSLPSSTGVLVVIAE